MYFAIDSDRWVRRRRPPEIECLLLSSSIDFLSRLTVLVSIAPLRITYPSLSNLSVILQNLTLLCFVAFLFKYCVICHLVLLLLDVCLRLVDTCHLSGPSFSRLLKLYRLRHLMNGNEATRRPFRPPGHLRDSRWSDPDGVEWKSRLVLEEGYSTETGLIPMRIPVDC